MILTFEVYIMKDQLDELEKQYLQALNNGHSYMSDEILHLLVVDFQRRYKKIVEKYIQLGADAYLIEEPAINMLESFLLGDVSNITNLDARILLSKMKYLEISMDMDYFDFNGKSTTFFTKENYLDDAGKVVEGIDKFAIVSRLASDFDFSDIPLMLIKLSFDLHHLNLSANNLFEADRLEMESIIGQIPRGVKILDLSDNLLGEGEPGILRDSFKLLPPDLVSLNLSENNFADFKAERLVNAFSELPDSLRSLNLGINNLNKFTKDDLKAILQSLPSGLEYLNLGGNKLSYSGKDFAEILTCLPSRLKSISFFDAYFTHFDENDLKMIFHALPLGIKCLNFGGVKFTEDFEKSFEKMIELLPRDLQVLDLMYSDTMSFSADIAIKAFKKLPRNLKKLNLAYNSLSHFEVNGLISFFSDLPESLISLDLKYNSFGIINFDDLKNIFASLPKSVKILDLTGCELDYCQRSMLGLPDDMTIIGIEKTFD